MKSFIRRNPYGPGLFFLNSAIGFFIICFPIMAFIALLIVTVLEAVVAYLVMSVYFRIRLKFKVFLISFAVANVVSTIFGAILLALLSNQLQQIRESGIIVLIVFILCFILSITIEAGIILEFVPKDIEKLRKSIVSMGYEHLLKNPGSVRKEMFVSIVVANVASYFFLLMIPVSFVIMNM